MWLLTIVSLTVTATILAQGDGPSSSARSWHQRRHPPSRPSERHHGRPWCAYRHTTVIRGNDVRTGVTAILPHPGNLFRDKVPGAIHIGNAFGKLAGSTQVTELGEQVTELGEIETPILLTSTLSVPKVADAVIDYMLALPGNENVRSINPLVAETNDGRLNDIRGRHVTSDDVWRAIEGASNGPVEEGAVGAGTGTVTFGFKGGIGTASRRLPPILGSLHHWGPRSNQLRWPINNQRRAGWSKAGPLLPERCN